MKISHYLRRVARIIDQSFIFDQLKEWVKTKRQSLELIISSKNELEKIARKEKPPKLEKVIVEGLKDRGLQLNEVKQALKHLKIFLESKKPSSYVTFDDGSAQGYHFHVLVGMDPAEFYTAAKKYLRDYTNEIADLKKLLLEIKVLLNLYERFEVEIYVEDLQKILSTYEQIDSQTAKVLQQISTEHSIPDYPRFEHRLHSFESLFNNLKKLFEHFQALGYPLISMDQQKQLAYQTLNDDISLDLPGEHINLQHLAMKLRITEAAAIAAAKEFVNTDPQLEYTAEFGPEIIRRKRF